MKVYVAGPMRGITEFNFPAFHDTAAELRARGHVVFDPAQHDRDGGFDPTSMSGHEDLAGMGFDLRAALLADTTWICIEADAICMLPGWAESRGATAEYHLARALDLQIWGAPA